MRRTAPIRWPGSRHVPPPIAHEFVPRHRRRGIHRLASVRRADRARRQRAGAGRSLHRPSRQPAGRRRTDRGDIADPEAALQATDGIAGCFHLAAIASVERGINDWLGTHRANLTGAISIFDAIRRHGTKVPSSTRPRRRFMAIARRSRFPKRRSAGRCRPMAPTNAAANCTRSPPATCMAFPRSACASSMFTDRDKIRSHPIPASSRSFASASERHPIDIYGDGAQTRDFVHVSDVVAALLAGMRLRAGSRHGVQCLHRSGDLGPAAGPDDRRSGRRKNPTCGTCRPGPAKSGTLWRPGGDAPRVGLGPMMALREGLATVLAHLRCATVGSPC
jgi:UDP-glucose 4-epimerase